MTDLRVMPMAGLNPTVPYPLFTDRANELATLERVAEDLRRGYPRHVALFGLRRIGKTLLCQEEIRRLLAADQALPVYLDMEDLCSSPEIFAQRYIGLSCFWALERGQGPADAYRTAADLLQTKTAVFPDVVRTASALINELGKQKADYSLLLNLAFEFPDRLARAVGRPLLYFLDEFPELRILSNFPGVGDPLKHFRAALQGVSQVAYVVTGSAISAMTHLVEDHASPLFLQFRGLELRPFTAEDTQVLVEKVAGRLLPEAHAAIYTYTFGYPFYVTALAERLRDLTDGAPEAAGAEQAAQAFLLEALTDRGLIYNYCRYVYDVSLQRARGYGVLKALLQILAAEDGLALSEIARRLRRQASATRGYLRWLADVDLVAERDGRYCYNDPVFRFWVAQMTQGIQLDAFPRMEDLKSHIAHLTERFQRVSTQLGRAKESEIRELLRKLAGQTVEGACFGQTGELHVPSFNRVESYRSPDGQVELDALAEAPDGTRWAVEVKWRLRRTGVKELTQLRERATGLQARAWCVSQGGFTPEAVAFAGEHGILFSTAEDLAALTRLSG
jgi:hypothetical protein